MRFDFPKHRSGDTWRGITSITLTDENDSVVDLTDCKLYIQFRSIYNLASPVVLLLSTENNTITLTNPTSGIISIPQQIINVPVGRYRYDLQVDFPDGTSNTYMYGEWEIIPGITTPSFDSTVNSRYNAIKINTLISLLCANSGNWNSVYNTVYNTSSVWEDVSNFVQNNSSNWQSYTIINELSGYFNTFYYNVTSNLYDLTTLVQNNSSSWAIDSLVRNLSGNWENTFNFVNSNSSYWDSVYSSVLNTSGNWDSVYTSVKDTSANWDSVYSSFLNTSGNLDSVFSSVKNTSGNWDSVYSSVKDTSGNWNSVYTSVKNTSANWDSVFSSVRKTSANWDSTFTSVKNTSANWDSVFSSVRKTSANWDSVFSSVLNTSANWDSVFSSVRKTSANWDSTFTSVKNTSANWDSVYTSVKNTSGNWNSVYTSVKDTSANWDSVYSSVLNTSANWDSVYSSVLNTSANWDSVYSSVLNTSANWDSVYTSVKDTSANWDSVYTSVKDTSANWDSVYSSVLNTSANWDSVYSSVLNTSANWDSVYTSVKDTSANWDSVYSSVLNTSANWDSVYSSVLNTSGNWDSVYTSVKDTSANWDSVYTTYNKNSATYATINFVDNKFLPLSGGTIKGNLTIDGDFTILGELSQIDTIISTTSSLEITNTGTTPALKVTQKGNSDIAIFKDDNNTSLIIKDGGNVGIGTDTPNEKFTVNGSISSNSIIYDEIGNSKKWNYAYTSVENTSGILDSVFTTVSQNSSVNWSRDAEYAELKALSSTWISTHTTVSQNSAEWLSDFSITQEFFDDFLTLGAASTLPNAFLKPANIGGAIFVGPENSKQGVLILSTNTLISANQRSGVTSNSTIHFGEGTEYRLIFSARKGTNSFNSTISGRIDMGFHNQISTNNEYPAYGCFFTSENGENWKAVSTLEPLVAEVTNTSIPCDETWRTFEIRIDKDANIAQFYVDNILVATHTQSIPKGLNTQTAIGYRCFRKKAANLNVELRIDWQSLIMKRNNQLWK
jgi:methyl-accepting chemotaxis protein